MESVPDTMDLFNRLGRAGPGAGGRKPNPRLGILYLLVVVMVAAWTLTVAVSAGAEMWAGATVTQAPRQAATPAPGTPATADQLRASQAAWAKTQHADTYDNGMGANTTCATCKSPKNWDPTQVVAAEASHDCTSCKREPGLPRPDLLGGVPVPQTQWKNISCDVCHQPIGESYSTSISFWNQKAGVYEPVKNSTELCEKCHEGRHGFEVVNEQEHSPAHKGWDCASCHGSHGTPVKCIDCHDVTRGGAAQIHASHASANCTGCHDAGGLPIWQDLLPDSRHFGEYIPQRFAHTLRSWPSHNIQTAVDCRRCHHPRGEVQGGLTSVGQALTIPNVRAAIVSGVSCDADGCHAGGATFEWCPVFPRDSAPTPEATQK